MAYKNENDLAEDPDFCGLFCVYYFARIRENAAVNQLSVFCSEQTTNFGK